jgi:WD40 repeat protein
VNLAAQLREKGYEVFLDRVEYAMGDDWKQVGAVALRNTQRLVLIATRPAVFESKPVEREVVLFTNRGRHIIPIFFGNTFAAEAQANPGKFIVLDRLPNTKLYIQDTTESLSSGPTTEVVENLTAVHRIMRRRKLRQTITLTAVSLLIAFSLFAVVSWVIAKTQRDIAESRLRVSESRRIASQAEQALVTDPHATANLAKQAFTQLRADDPAVLEVQQALLNAIGHLPGRSRDTSNSPLALSGDLSYAWRYDGTRLHIETRVDGESLAEVEVPKLVGVKVGVASDRPLLVVSTQDGAYVVEYREGKLHTEALGVSIESSDSFPIVLREAHGWLAIEQLDRITFVRRSLAASATPLVIQTPEHASACLTEAGPMIIRKKKGDWFVEQLSGDRLVQVVQLPNSSKVDSVAVAPSGNHLALLANNPFTHKATLSIVTLRSDGQILGSMRLNIDSEVHALRFLSSNDLLIVRQNQTPLIFLPATKTLKDTSLSWAPHFVTPFRDGSDRFILFDAERSKGAILFLKDGSPRFEEFSAGNEHRIDIYAVSPDGSWVATAGVDQFTRIPIVYVHARLLNGTFSGPSKVYGLRSPVFRLALDDDGLLWAAGLGGEIVEFSLGHKDTVLAFAALDDRSFLSAGRDGRVLRWEGAISKSIVQLDSPISHLALSFDKTTFAVLTDPDDGGPEILIYRLDSSEHPLARGAVGSHPLWLGQWKEPPAFATLDSGGTLEFRSQVNGSVLSRVSIKRQLELFDVSPSGKRLAWVDANGYVGVSSRITDNLHQAVTSQAYGGIRRIHFLDDHHFLSGDQEGRLLLWSATSPSDPPMATSVHHDEGFFYAIGSSPDGLHAASVAQGNSIHTWRMEADRLVAAITLPAHQGQTGTLLFSNRPGWLASANSSLGPPPWDLTVRLWRYDASGVSGRFVQLPHTSRPQVLKFLAEDSAIVTGTMDGRVRYWPLKPKRLENKLSQRALPLKTTEPAHD